MTAVRGPGVGRFAPLFNLPCDGNPTFQLGAMGGRWVVLMFHGSLAAPHSRAAHEILLAQRALFDRAEVVFFGVSIDPADIEARGMGAPRSGLRCFADYRGAVSRGYGVLEDKVHTPTVFLIDRMLRLVAAEPIGRMQQIMERLAMELAAEKADATPQFAPVMTIPRIFEPELCRALIAFYEAEGGKTSGFMRQVGDKTVGMLDDTMKRRKDAHLPDGPLREAACDRISQRLIPAVARFFGWRATRIERYVVACYSSQGEGFFRRHRDNTTAATAHRTFAVTVNLNAEDYDGGELCFPEFGSRTYKPPTGDAVVFGCGLLHEATPVTRGTRFAFLPFLYDEAGKVLRDASISLIVPPADPAEDEADAALA